MSMVVTPRSHAALRIAIDCRSRVEQVTENMKALDVYEKMKQDTSIKERMDDILANAPADADLFGRWQ